MGVSAHMWNGKDRSSVKIEPRKIFPLVWYGESIFTFFQLKISIHAHIRLYIDTEIGILGELMDVLGQLSRRCIPQPGEVTISRVDPFIKYISAVHHFRDIVCSQSYIIVW